MTHLTHCIYASAATTPWDAASLRALLDVSRRNNQRLGLSGMLLYADGSFFQVLEGERTKVEQMFEKIAADPRHGRVTRIIDEPIPQRAFDEWTMGFPSLEPHELASLPGVNDFFGAHQCLAQLDAGRARKLLTAFAAGRWRQRISDAQP